MKLEAKVKAIKPPKSYGNITLSSVDFPDVANLKLGDVKSVVINIDITELRKPDNWDISEGRAKPTDVIARVNIKGIQFPKEEKK